MDKQVQTFQRIQTSKSLKMWQKVFFINWAILLHSFSLSGGTNTTWTQHEFDRKIENATLSTLQHFFIFIILFDFVFVLFMQHTHKKHFIIIKVSSNYLEYQPKIRKQPSVPIFIAKTFLHTEIKFTSKNTIRIPLFTK